MILRMRMIKWMTSKTMMKMTKWTWTTRMKMRKSPSLNHPRRDPNPLSWRYQIRITILLLNQERFLIYLSKTKLQKYPLKLINKILKILKIFDFKILYSLNSTHILSLFYISFIKMLFCTFSFTDISVNDLCIHFCSIC